MTMPAKKTASPPAPKALARKRNPTAKARAQQKKKKRNDASDSSEDSADEAPAPVSAKTVLDVDWKDPTLSVKLLSLIAENTDIKQSLFPPCGPNASTTDGGGKPKVTAQWELAVLLLGKMDKYRDAIDACDTPKKKLVYANKIKNRIGTMGKITRGFIDELGATGAGIRSAAEIDTKKQNKFTNKWAEITSKCPWFFEMRTLIAQRPNLVPTGLGHSTSEVTEGVIIPESLSANDDAENDDEQEEGEDDDDHTSGTPIDWSASPEPETLQLKRTFDEINDDEGSNDNYQPSSPVPSESGPVLVNDDNDDFATTEELSVQPDEPEAKGKGGKGKGGNGKGTQRKNPPKPGNSKPAGPAPTAATSKPAKKTKLAEFSDIAKLEEKTRQREIELAQLRTRQAMSTMDVKGRLAEKREDRRHLERKGKQDEKMAKLRLKELKMVHAHELRMVAARTESASASTSHAASFVDSRSRESASHYSSSEPADYGDFDAFGSIPASDYRFGGDAAGPLSSGLDAEYSQYNHLGNPFDKGPM
ncbi:hypothetical protein B0H19DRAFT_1155192 [Mycena capillaripes]|nr:hypothetical protein B0H19DRAFT_1155192 [Mycena capillaripes]